MRSVGVRSVGVRSVGVRSVGIVSLHDVAPATLGESLEMLSMVESRGLRATLLVIPGPFGGSRLSTSSGFAAWLRQAAHRGHEIALHGWAHQAVHDPDGPAGHGRRVVGRTLARGCAEFHGLGRAEAARRIELGRRALTDAGLSAVGFTPPGWLASPGTMVALRQAGFRYTTTHAAVIDLESGRRIWIGAVSQRPGSIIAGVGAAATRRVGTWALSSDRCLRLALHPRDLDDGRLVRATVQVLDLVAERGCTTYAELVGTHGERRAS